MKNKPLAIIVASLVLILLSGCGIAFRVLLGVDSTPTWNSPEEIVDQVAEHQLPEEFTFVLDTADFYYDLNKRYDQLKKELVIVDQDSNEYKRLNGIRNDDGQPAQFRLFQKDGTEIFKIVNCYIEKPLKMDWNVQGCFNHFPPTIKRRSLNKHYIDLDFFLSNAKLLDGKKILLKDLPKTDYYALVLWNDFVKRGTRTLIETVRTQVIPKEESLVVLYLNNHNAAIWQLIDNETRNEIKKAIADGQEES